MVAVIILGMSEIPEDPERRLRIERKLAEISSTPVSAKWSQDYGDKVDLTLPYRCSFSGVISEASQSKMTGVYLTVPEELRGNQIGERLTRALAVVAIQCGLPILRADLESHYALNSWRRAFGDERLSFYHDNSSEHTGLLPMSADEAVQSLERAYLLESGNEEGDISIDVEVDLTGLDVSEWEIPLTVS